MMDIDPKFYSSNPHPVYDLMVKVTNLYVKVLL